MLKNLKRASAIMLSLAMAVQFGLADTYYANTLSEEPINNRRNPRTRTGNG